MSSAALTADWFYAQRRRQRIGAFQMGRKFKLSDMIPNAWFYKLRDRGVVRSDKNDPHPSLSLSSTSSSSSSAIIHPSTSRPSQPLPRKSYHFTRKLAESDGFYDSPRNTEFSDIHLADPPRKLSKQRDRRRTAAGSPPNLVGSAVSSAGSCGATVESIWSKSDFPPEFSASPFDPSPDGKFRTDTVLATESFHDAVICTASKTKSCVGETNLNDNEKTIGDNGYSFTCKAHSIGDLKALQKHELAPIITKAATFTDMVGEIKKKDTKNSRNKKNSVKMDEMNSRRSLSVRMTKEENIAVKEQRSSPSRKFPISSPGVRLRINSPRIGSRKINGGSGRKSISSSSTSTSSGSNKSLSDSLAIMKSSFDPKRDFRESMVEMIVENNIRASKDLEDLLACYLSLNADEYHDLIIDVFKQIWINLSNPRVTQ